MAAGQTNRVLRSLRRAVLLRDGAGLSDGQLLECYLRHREESALAALVHRHSSMVWGVCRRVLGHQHDAEDAFQATFLVLVRKAASIVPRERVGNWLYGVASHTALKARALAARRRPRERQVTDMPDPPARPCELWDDVRSLLDQELSRLPDKYQAPIVLCDLGGKTYREAARQLGCPEGTLAARLARGRTLLARRLTRHGPVLSGSALAMMLSVQAAPAAAPAALVSATVKAAWMLAVGPAAAGLVSVKAMFLMEGVVRTMLINKLKTVTAIVLTVGALGAGVGTRGFIAASEGRASAPGGQAAPATAKAPQVRAERNTRDAELEELQRRLEEQQRLLELKELELRELRMFVEKLQVDGQAAKSKYQGATAEKARQVQEEKQAASRQKVAVAADDQLEALKLQKMLEQQRRQLQEREAAVQELTARLRQQLAETKLAQESAPSGDVRELRQQNEKLQQIVRQQQEQLADKEAELRKLRDALRSTSGGKLSADRQDTGKQSADADRDAKMMKLKHALEDQQRAIQEKDNELKKLKRALEEARDRAQDFRAEKTAASGKGGDRRDAQLEEMARLHKEQERKLQELDSVLNKLKEQLKLQSGQRPKQ